MSDGEPPITGIESGIDGVVLADRLTYYGMCIWPVLPAPRRSDKITLSVCRSG